MKCNKIPVHLKRSPAWLQQILTPPWWEGGGGGRGRWHSKSRPETRQSNMDRRTRCGPPPLSLPPQYKHLPSLVSNACGTSSSRSHFTDHHFGITLGSVRKAATSLRHWSFASNRHATCGSESVLLGKSVLLGTIAAATAATATGTAAVVYSRRRNEEQQKRKKKRYNRQTHKQRTKRKTHTSNLHSIYFSFLPVPALKRARPPQQQQQRRGPPKTHDAAF